MACSKNVRLIRWYFHLIPLNSFRQCSLITAHVFQLSYRQGPSFPVRHSSQTVLTAVLWPRCQLLLSCGVAFDMFLERYQKFGGLTLVANQQKNTQQKKQNILQIQAPMEMKSNSLCYSHSFYFFEFPTSFADQLISPKTVELQGCLATTWNMTSQWKLMPRRDWFRNRYLWNRWEIRTINFIPIEHRRKHIWLCEVRIQDWQ